MMRSSPDASNILVLGIGNILWADEGFGVRCIETLDRDHRLPEHLVIMDGGTQGLNLVPAVGDARCLLVFDAVDFGAEPGTLITVRDRDVPMFMAAKKMSLHQTGFQEVLSCADLLGRLPEHITLIGVQPFELEDYGGSLTPPVKARVPEAIALGLLELAGWGMVATARSDGDPAPDAVLSEVGQDRYERDRPTAEEACRIGDARVLLRHIAAANEAGAV